MPSYSQFANIPSVSVAPATFTPAVFKPTEFKIEEPSWSLGKAAIDEHNRIVETVSSHQDAIQAAIDKLPLADEEREWVNNYAQSVQDRIQTFIDAGDYRGAMRESTRLANSAATDRRLLSRHARFRGYEINREEILKDKNIDELTRERWLAQNSYDTGKVENADGTVNQWRASFNPVRSVKLDDVVSKAAAHVAERSNQWQVSNSVAGVAPDQYKVGAGMQGVSKSSGYSGAVHEKTVKQITDVFNELMDLYPDEMAWLQQDYDNQKWVLEEMNKKLNNGEELNDVERARYDIAKRRLTKGAGLKSAAEYLWTLMGNTIINSAYRRTASGSNNDVDYTKRNESQGAAFAQDILNNPLFTGGTQSYTVDKVWSGVPWSGAEANGNAAVGAIGSKQQ